MHQLFYASSEINRQGDYRNNNKLIEKIMLDENTNFIPYFNGKNLFKKTNENIDAIKLNINHLKVCLKPRELNLKPLKLLMSELR